LLLYLLVGWSSLAGNSKTFADSVVANSFSGQQVICVVLFLAMIVVDRALYTCMHADNTQAIANAGTPSPTQSPNLGPSQQLSNSSTPGLDTIQPSRSLGASLSLRDFPMTTMPQLNFRFLAVMAQKILLVVQLIVLHWLCIMQWVGLEQPTLAQLSMTNNMALLAFYVLYMMFWYVHLCS
jgi:hypothetical protein